MDPAEALRAQTTREEWKELTEPTSFVQKFFVRNANDPSMPTEIFQDCSFTIDAEVVQRSHLPLLRIQLTHAKDVSEQAADDALDALNVLLKSDKIVPRTFLASTDPRFEWRLTLKILEASNAPLLDPVLAAITLAMNDVRLPELDVKHALDNEENIRSEDIAITGRTQKLPEIIDLTAATCGFDSKQALVEWTMSAFDRVDNVVQVVVNAKSEIIYLRTRGSLASAELIEAAVNRAVLRRKYLSPLYRSKSDKS